MFCENCGKELSNSFKFCNGCGVSLNQTFPTSGDNVSNFTQKIEPNRDNSNKLIIDNNITTGQLFVKTLLSAGLYYWINIWQLEKVIDKNCNSKLSQSKLLLITICIYGWGSYLLQFGIKTATLAGILIIIASGILIYWNFKVKKVLEDYALYALKTNLRMNGFYTFILGQFYFCYCINDLEELKKRNDQIIALQSKS